MARLVLSGFPALLFSLGVLAVIILFFILLIKFFLYFIAALIILSILGYFFRKTIMRWYLRRVLMGSRKAYKKPKRSGIDKGSIDADFKVKK